MEEKIVDLLKIVLPAAMVLAGTVITNRTNARRFSEEKEKLRIENDLLLRNKRIEELLLNKKELFKLIQHISDGFSITKNYRMQESNFSWENFDSHYAEMNELSLQAQLLAHMYFPTLQPKVDEICNSINLAWGQQKNLFLQYQLDKQLFLNEFVKYSSIVQEKCCSTMRSIVYLADSEC
ncbi:MAG TPA: hypothetical protein DCP36_12595 [Sporomusaceae bacterium]|nr:hypothetical protein [Sporomusaceae bacterium]